jgi:hypothetical protein
MFERFNATVSRLAGLVLLCSALLTARSPETARGADSDSGASKRVWTFDTDQPDKIAPGFTNEVGRREVAQDGDNRVLAQKARNVDATFNNCIGVYIQGANAGWPNAEAGLDGFTRTGQLKPEVGRRLERLIREADKRGMVVMVGILSPRKDQDLYDDDAIRWAIQEAGRFLVKRNLKNIFIYIIHEFDQPDRIDHFILRVFAESAVAESCRESEIDPPLASWRAGVIIRQMVILPSDTGSLNPCTAAVVPPSR